MERTGLWNKVDFRKKTEPYSIIHVFRINVLKYSAFPPSLFLILCSLFLISYGRPPLRHPKLQDELDKCEGYRAEMVID